MTDPEQGRPPLNLVALVDQAIAMLPLAAQVIAAYHRELLAAGMGPTEALALAMRYQDQIVRGTGVA